MDELRHQCARPTGAAGSRVAPPPSRRSGRRPTASRPRAPGGSGRSPLPVRAGSLRAPAAHGAVREPVPRHRAVPVPYPRRAARDPARLRGGVAACPGRDRGAHGARLAGVVTLVVLISRAAPGAARGCGADGGPAQVINTRVDDGRVHVRHDTQAQGDAVFAAIRSRPGTRSLSDGPGQTTAADRPPGRVFVRGRSRPVG